MSQMVFMLSDSSASTWVRKSANKTLIEYPLSGKLVLSDLIKVICEEVMMASADIALVCGLTFRLDAGIG